MNSVSPDHLPPPTVLGAVEALPGLREPPFTPVLAEWKHGWGEPELLLHLPARHVTGQASAAYAKISVPISSEADPETTLLLQQMGFPEVVKWLPQIPQASDPVGSYTYDFRRWSALYRKAQAEGTLMDHPELLRGPRTRDEAAKFYEIGRWWVGA